MLWENDFCYEVKN